MLPRCSRAPSVSSVGVRCSSCNTSSTPIASVEAYTSAITGKTASLFGTACRVGGMVSAVDDPTLDALTEFGQHLGMCFQIVDDVLDVTGTDESLGKPAGNDILEGVYTLPVIHALGTSVGSASCASCWAARSTARSSTRRARWSPRATRSSSRSRRPAGTPPTPTAVLASTTSLDAEVADGLTRLVDTLVTRQF